MVAAAVNVVVVRLLLLLFSKNSVTLSLGAMGGAAARFNPMVGNGLERCCRARHGAAKGLLQGEGCCLSWSMLLSFCWFCREWLCVVLCKTRGPYFFVLKKIFSKLFFLTQKGKQPVWHL